MKFRAFPSFSRLAPIAGLTLVLAGPVLGAGNAAVGKSGWTAEHSPAGADGPRSCATCHNANLTKPGKHATTGKPIEPMAVSVNPKRLTDPVKVEKWLGRNCRWTLGRDCTAQEKADFIAFIQGQ